jgi:hypothetical protein
VRTGWRTVTGCWSGLATGWDCSKATDSVAESVTQRLSCVAHVTGAGAVSVPGLGLGWWLVARWIR